VATFSIFRTAALISIALMAPVQASEPVYSCLRHYQRLLLT